MLALGVSYMGKTERISQKEGREFKNARGMVPKPGPSGATFLNFRPEKKWGYHSGPLGKSQVSRANSTSKPWSLVAPQGKEP